MTTQSGSCLCGAVTFEITLPVLFVGHCHCSMCRKAHGAGYVTWIAAAEDGFKVTKGEDKIGYFRSSEHLVRSFCAVCGSSMFCNDETHDNIIDVTLANMDGSVGQEPDTHIFFDHGADWVKINDDLRKLGGDGGLNPL